MSVHQFIVSIGASAGGLAALTSFFEHTPIDGVSYIIIPHLSTEFKSQMVEILSRHSNLEVLEANEGMEVEVNKVYLIPSNKYMGIRNGRLYLSDKEGQALPHMTVDSFFTSLAAERGNKAIAVVLSGVGTDGCKGAVAIENAGGVVMVQEPSDAKFDGMPRATIAVSNTPYILAADALPGAIQRYIYDNESPEVSEDDSVSANLISNITNLIRDQYPFDFSDYKLPTLDRRVKRRMLQRNIHDEQFFYSFLQQNPSEVELLISDFLIGVTSFFRDPGAFDIVRNMVIPRIVEQKAGSDHIKIWVAGCATGEEAYSLAILFEEFFGEIGREMEVKIFATDINRLALDQASKGVFPGSIEKSVSRERLINFFDKGEDNYKVKPEIRKMLIFARHDLTTNPPYCEVDLISCRNMLIYIKPDLQKQILLKLGFGLRPGGFLFLGSSETLSGVQDDFSEVSSQWKVFQNNRSSRRIHLNSAFTAPLADLPLRPAAGEQTPRELSWPPSMGQGISEVIITESGLCGVKIDEEGKVLQAYGDLSPYLKPERFNFNLRELLPETLAMAFSASLYKALKYSQRVRLNNIEYIAPDSSKKGTVSLIVSPVVERKSRMKSLLVLFKPGNESQEASQGGHDFEIDSQTRDYISQLEEDVYQLKQDIIASGDLLESSKEAMQTYNEELLSANEELQSANEELQSVNEELQSVNNEHQDIISELKQLNDDLNNYFSSNINGQLFVDKDILLKKFSPGALRHINIRETDIGRPLNNITTNIKFDTLVEDIQKVIANGEIVVREVESMEGRIYQVMTSPYLKKGDKEIHGATITFYDISELKKTRVELDKSNKILGLATVAAEIGTWSLDVRTQELICSPRTKEIFGFAPEADMTLDAALGRVVNEQRTLVRDAIESAISSGERLELEYPLHNLQDDSLRWIRVIGNLIHTGKGEPEYLTGIMQDVTDHKLDDLRKNDFISIVSHELKTPLTSLKSYIQILLARAQKAQDTFAADSLDKAHKQVKKMTTLINGFLNISRLEAGKILLSREIFNIDALIDEIVEEISVGSPGRNIVKLQGCEAFVNADKDKIGQVISNLLNNAIKYSPLGERIEISCSKSDDTVQVSIKDDGIGMSPEEQESLFNRFYRIKNQKTETISGFGIGLYLSLEIVQRHNGKIWVESEPNKGSTFFFSLPLS